MGLETLLLPFHFAFMQKAFFIGIIIAIPAALLSCFLVVKGWALMGDAVSHAILPGVVLAYLLGAPLIIGAFATGMICALATGYLTQNSRVKPDTVMGVVFSGMFGIGIVIYIAIDSALHLDHILFGNILGIRLNEVIMALVISTVVSIGLLAKSKDLLLYSFDATQARASGLSVGRLYYGLLAAMTLTVVATLSATGLILAIGLMIAPGAIAFLLVRRFTTMMLVAVAVAITAMTMGIYASFFLDSAPAPTIVLVFSLMFIAAFVAKVMRQSRAETAS